MDTFRIVVLSIAVIVLIGFLAFAGSMIKNDVRSQTFPPVSQQCPDGWTYAEQKTGDVITSRTCTSTTTNLGTGGSAMKKLYPRPNDITLTGTFKSPGWGINMKPSVTVCQQRNWAKKNGVSWDGVSNYNGCD
jgi:hypothetical protein